MQPNNVNTEQKHDISTELKNKKAKLDRLKTERSEATGFFDYFKRQSLDAEILAVAHEVAALTKQADKDNLLVKAGDAAHNAVSKLWGKKTKKQIEEDQAARLNHYQEMRNKYHTKS